MGYLMVDRGRCYRGSARVTMGFEHRLPEGTIGYLRVDRGRQKLSWINMRVRYYGVLA